MELNGILLSLIRSSDRFRAIRGRLCMCEQGHAFLDTPILMKRHDVVRDER